MQHRAHANDLQLTSSLSVADILIATKNCGKRWHEHLLHAKPSSQHPIDRVDIGTGTILPCAPQRTRQPVHVVRGLRDRPPYMSRPSKAREGPALIRFLRRASVHDIGHGCICFSSSSADAPRCAAERSERDARGARARSGALRAPVLFSGFAGRFWEPGCHCVCARD